MVKLKSPWITALIVAGIVLVCLVVAIPVGWYLISPLFINRQVAEGLPAPAIEIIPATATAAMEAAQVEPTREMKEPMPTEAAAGPVALRQGNFYSIAHDGSGRATVYQLADGSRILRFESFQVLNGPDLHVYLAPIDPVPDSVGAEIPGSVDLGKLKGNIGDQNYDLPPDLDLAGFKSVVIWCQPFRVPFAAAALAAP